MTEPTEHGPPTYSMILTSVGEDRLGAMKVLRTYRPEIGPTEAKDILGQLPHRLFDVVGYDERERVRRRFGDVGAVVDWE